jgi:hypothetical protein
VRCVGPVMTEGKVRLTRHKGPDMALVETRLVRGVSPVMTKGKVRLTRHKGPDMA